MDALVIRLATLEDADALEDLAARMANFEVPPWRTADEITGADARAMIDAVRHASPTSDVFIAERNGVPAGCLHVVETEDFFGRRHAHVSVISTTAASEGTGVGAALMRFADDWGRARQLPFITLNVFAANARARRFYVKAGYEEEVVRYAKAL